MCSRIGALVFVLRLGLLQAKKPYRQLDRQRTHLSSREVRMSGMLLGFCVSGWQSLRCCSLVELQSIEKVVQLSVLLLHKAIRLWSTRTRHDVLSQGKHVQGIPNGRLRNSVGTNHEVQPQPLSPSQ